jgi:hypothetical protein
VDAEFSKHITELNERNWDRFRNQLDTRTAELRSEIRTGLADLRAELIKWMFAFWIVSWIATVVPIAGLILQTR